MSKDKTHDILNVIFTGQAQQKIRLFSAEVNIAHSQNFSSGENTTIDNIKKFNNTKCW